MLGEKTKTKKRTAYAIDSKKKIKEFKMKEFETMGQANQGQIIDMQV